jgi:hypothetical protein
VPCLAKGSRKSQNDENDQDARMDFHTYPHTEAILRGVKKTVYRTRPTKIRGRICIYASLARYSATEKAAMMAGYGIDDVACDDLPCGVIVGTVELYDCDGGERHVRNPERATRLRKPKNHPQPVWFNPFSQAEASP